MTGKDNQLFKLIEEEEELKARKTALKEKEKKEKKESLKSKVKSGRTQEHEVPEAGTQLVEVGQPIDFPKITLSEQEEKEFAARQISLEDIFVDNLEKIPESTVSKDVNDIKLEDAKELMSEISNYQ